MQGCLLAVSREESPHRMLTLADIGFAAPAALLERYGLCLQHIADDAPIPGSFWGEPEAGLIGDCIYARNDTPVHSLLHEAAHLIVMPADRRITIHTDASDSVAEEDAACALQILLANELPGVGSTRLMGDMDAWGYTFRLGSTRAWFERDAEDAFASLFERGLVDARRKLQQSPCAAMAATNGIRGTRHT